MQFLQDVHLKPQLQLSSGQQSTITGAANNINGFDIGSSGATLIGVDNSSTPSNMDPPSENVNGGAIATPSTINAANHNRPETTDVNLDSEEKDEFVEIKVSPKLLSRTWPS